MSLFTADMGFFNRLRDAQGVVRWALSTRDSGIIDKAVHFLDSAVPKVGHSDRESANYIGAGWDLARGNSSVRNFALDEAMQGNDIDPPTQAKISKVFKDWLVDEVVQKFRLSDGQIWIKSELIPHDLKQILGEVLERLNKFIKGWREGLGK